jgi:hypothetical protein
MTRVDVNEDEISRIHPGSSVECLTFGVTQRARVVVSDHDPPDDVALQRVHALSPRRRPAEIFLEGILDVSHAGGSTEPGVRRLQEG